MKYDDFQTIFKINDVGIFTTWLPENAKKAARLSKREEEFGQMPIGFSFEENVPLNGLNKEDIPFNLSNEILTSDKSMWIHVTRLK